MKTPFTALALCLALTAGCVREVVHEAADSGAPPDAAVEGRCASHLDCPAGAYCGARGQCTRDCALDVDCEVGARCDARGRCVSADGGVIVAVDVVTPQDTVAVDVVTPQDTVAVDVVTPQGTVDAPVVAVDVATPRDIAVSVDDGYLSDEDPPGVGGGSCDEDGATIPGLPLSAGACARVSQGVCGGFSHAGKYAIDIIVDAGTTVLAPVAGRVVGVRQIVPDTCMYSSHAGRDTLRRSGECPSSQGTDYGNYVAIAPSDGALPSVVMAHMRAGTARVRVDDVVTAGQALGLSGSTGLSTAPHVHFACVQRGSEYGTFPTAPCNFTWRASATATTNTTGRPGAGTTVCGLDATASTCVAGAPCALTAMPCRTGTITCTGGVASCTATGNAAAGAACGSGMVCDGAGACGACSAGSACTPPGQPCRTGAVSCASGSAVCTATGNSRAGVDCGSGMVCNGSGACVSCAAGMSCAPPGQPCRTGTLSCSLGSPVCTATGNAAAGATCGSGMVCDGAGACGACGAGSACTPPGQPCRTGVVSCATGSAACTATGTLSPGASCGSGMVCDGGGSCVACSEGSACAPPGQPCRTGAVSCASGGAVCNATGSAPMGTSCGGGMTCDGSGACRAGEACNGIDDNGNGVVDEGLPGCWRTVYRFRTSRGYPIEARCLGVGVSPPSACADYVLEREAFVLHASSVPGTFELRQCSYLTEHIALDAASSDRSLLQSRGYDCSLVLGYAYAAGSGPASGATPFAYSCPLYRFSYGTPGGGAKIFSTGADSTSGLTCEAPARANVQSNAPCFSGRPSGC